MDVSRPRRSLFVLGAAALTLVTLLAVAVRPVLGAGAGRTHHRAARAIVADAGCFASFSKGANGTLFSACISNEGNVNNVVFPAGKSQITTGEGSAICSGLDTENHHGWDQGATEAGLGAPTISEPKGANTLPLTITRSTTDGHFQLTQKFTSFDAVEHDIDFAMTLKNVGTTTLENVKLTRSFDADIDGSATGAHFATTDNSVMGWNDPVGNGLILSTRAGTWGSFTDSLVMLFSAWNSTPSALGGSANCLPFVQSTPTGTSNDYVGELIFNLGTMAPGAQKTVNLRYGQM